MNEVLVLSMASFRTDDSGSPVSPSRIPNDYRDMSDLVCKMDKVIRLLQEQRVCSVSLCSIILFLEYNYVCSSVWCLVFGNWGYFVILLQLCIVAADFMDVIWSFIFVCRIVFTESEGCQGFSLSFRTAFTISRGIGCI